MSNLSSIDTKFLLSLFSDPWMLAVHLLDILIVAYLIYRFIKALTGTKIMSLVQGLFSFDYSVYSGMDWFHHYYLFDEPGYYVWSYRWGCDFRARNPCRT